MKWFLKLVETARLGELHSDAEISKEELHRGFNEAVTKAESFVFTSTQAGG